MSNKNPTQLICSNSYEGLITHTKEYLKNIFCKQVAISARGEHMSNHSSGQNIESHKSFTDCLTCKQIENNQSHNIIWLSSDTGYKLRDLDIIFEKASLSLDDEEKVFFVIEKAELLNHACSNKLLKIIEEPPSGYYFIFLTQRPQDIIDTIKSRCTQSIIKSDQEQEDPLMKYFTKEKIEAADFLSLIDKAGINEQHTTELVDDILKYWMKNYPNDPKVEVLKDSFNNLPRQGGSKLFWKNFYTKFYSI